MQKNLLLETIKIEEGKIYNLIYHQKRCDNSRKVLFNSTDRLHLSSIINPPKMGLWRCRILYAKTFYSIEYIPYKAKKIHTLKIVPSTIDYSHKYANREALNQLSLLHDDVDEIIIEKDGYLSDTTIANIAFYDGTKWFTPDKPLLAGTTRKKLLDEGFLKIKDIKKEDLFTYSHVALMNAMLGFVVLNRISIKDLQGDIYAY